MKTIITIEHIASGQPRAYADSRYEAVITFYSAESLIGGAGHFFHYPKERALQFFRENVHEYKDDPAWHEPKLVMCEAIGPTPEMDAMVHPKWPNKANCRWRIAVMQPYLD